MSQDAQSLLWNRYHQYLFRVENCTSEKFTNLSKTTQLTIGRTWFWNKIFLTLKLHCKNEVSEIVYNHPSPPLWLPVSSFHDCRLSTAPGFGPLGHAWEYTVNPLDVAPAVTKGPHQYSPALILCSRSLCRCMNRMIWVNKWRVWKG